MVTKIYVVLCTPHGDFFGLIGVFSSMDKANQAKEHYLQKNPDSRGDAAFEPWIDEFELDEEQQVDF